MARPDAISIFLPFHHWKTPDATFSRHCYHTGDMKSNGTINVQIDRMVRRISRKFRPDRIILFGSRARGDSKPGSDVDLLVIMTVRGSLRKKRVELRLAVHDIQVPKDILVVRPEDAEVQKDIPGTIVRYALREGRTLYARA